ncbi:MAG: sigma-70 family RNA polymerase sigma factor [Bacteroidota bacterium]
MKSLDQNFGLSSHQFDEMVKKLKDFDNALLDHIYHVHYEPCRDYLRERFTIDEEMAYDLFMDALVSFRAKILNGKITYGNIKFLYTRLTINCYMDRHRRKKRLDVALSNFIKTINQGVEVVEEKYFNILQKCVSQLKDKDAALLRQLFLDEIPGEELAHQLGITYAALRKRKARALDRLKELMFEMIKTYGDEKE